MRSFNRHTTGYINYTYTARDFKNTPDDYRVHDGRLGVNHDLSHHTSLSLEAGAYKKISDISEDEEGGLYSANLTQRFKHGSISFGIMQI